MSDIDFQNGFLCGMATKGLARSGEYYKPLIYNDSGVYNYFYIDFRRAMSPFSLGMFNESIVIHDSVQLSVVSIEYVSTGIYKIYCNISGKIHGITVLNKVTSRLSFSNGERVPVFSTHMYISGQESYIDGGYIYDTADLIDISSSITETVDDIVQTDAFAMDAISESATFSFAASSITEAATVVLT